VWASAPINSVELKGSESLTVGRKFQPGEVLSKSANLIAANPVLLLPQVIAVIPGLLNTMISRASLGLDLLSLLVSVASAVLGLIVSGAYPEMVQSVLGGQKPSVGFAMGKAYNRFWSLLAAGILVVLIVVVGFIALVVPGIILLTWYAYTIPAIMLEDRGALDGMSASRAFGRDKKWDTFLTFLVILLVAFVALIIEGVFAFVGPTLVGDVIGQLLFIPISAWASVIVSYIYISYGPSSAAGQPGAPSPGWVQSPQQPGPLTGTPAARFCSACGSPIEPNARFCRNCGKAV
jgi:hypothetical protein